MSVLTIELNTHTSTSLNEIWAIIQPHVAHLNEEETFKHLLFNLQSCNFDFPHHIVVSTPRHSLVKIDNCACVLRFYEQAGATQIFGQVTSMFEKAIFFVKTHQKCWYNMRDIACHQHDVRGSDVRCVQYFVEANSAFKERLIDVPFYFGKRPMAAIELPAEDVVPAVLIGTTTTTTTTEKFSETITLVKSPTKIKS